ncbi:hypothetical protein CEXT_689311 [Caerostris extrusa]|uniref:Uncharacterized protein n=1 Tax=Caerostris extrusa TaxID=172846 RepID=A0AAV4RPQ1_CAEEX|nr:hypothetical protein CEXT_689311 [Caerostris extrusa]
MGSRTFGVLSGRLVRGWGGRFVPDERDTSEATLINPHTFYGSCNPLLAHNRGNAQIIVFDASTFADPSFRSKNAVPGLAHPPDVKQNMSPHFFS